MTLHEAIEKLLRLKGHPMTTTEIASELNINKWYQKKDGSEIQPFQIHGRTRNYPQIFNRDGSLVYLENQSINLTGNIQSENVKLKPKTQLSELSDNVHLLEKVLMNEKNFKTVENIDNAVPDRPGLYCIRIKRVDNLPTPFDRILSERNHNIIYIGIASQSLYKRFLNQELRAKGHGTFFRSIGAVLGFKPLKGSLKNKSNKRNYKFSQSDELKIIDWINKNLIVNWVEFQESFDEFETTLIQRYLPLLNLAKNPLALKELSELRAECVRIANS